MRAARWFSTMLGMSAVFAGACRPDAQTNAPGRTPPEQGGQEELPSGERLEISGGMWLPSQLPEQAERLEHRGLRVDPETLAKPLRYPLGAVVSLGGCSASFVSDQGLILTNHHCVTDALQYNSTREANLLDKGFLSEGLDREPSIGPTGRVYVTRSFSDITQRMRDGLETLTDDVKRAKTMEQRKKDAVAECEKTAPDARCEVAGFFGDGQFFLIERQELKDVRLVYAPARGIGNFGGEIDNWRWPRHTGDFAFYRAYTGPSGAASPYAKENVPYRPRHHLKVAKKPLGVGDFVMVAGYPGATYRLHTGAEAEEAVTWHYPHRIRFCEEYLAALGRVKKADREAALRAVPLERRLSNTLTYTRGALEGLTKGGVAEQRRRRDEAVESFVRADPKRRERLDVFDALRDVFEQRKQTRDQDASLGEILRMSSLVGAAMTLVRLAEERPKPDAEREPEFQERNWERLEQGQRALERRYHPKLDRALLSLAAERAARLPAEQRKPLLVPLTGKEDPDAALIARSVEALYARTRLQNTDHRVKLLKTASLEELAASKDPIIRFALALRPLQVEQERRDDAERGRLLLLRPQYVSALREYDKGPIAPDANSTLRVTYGSVKGYRPTPGAPAYDPFTVLSGVVRKDTGEEPFDAPKELLEAAARKPGPYADKRLGEVPVNFLADLDITGGNSGSPTLDANGELTGVAFDGNYESMASDWAYLPELTRSIHVDIRYILWVMAAVDRAERVLVELGQPTVE